MITVDEARARIVAALVPVGTETVSLAAAHGRVLAEDLTARRSQPSFDASAMDGYAVRAADLAALPARLRQIGAAPAGKGFEGTVGPGETVRIFTGGPVPAGADTIILQEDVTIEDGLIVVRTAEPLGRHIRKLGIDFSAGDVGLTAGRRLGARAIGLAGAMNRPWVTVHRRPRIAILATGDEVVMPGDPMGPDQIPSSNSLALAAFVAACGAEPVHLGIAVDDVADLTAKARMAGACDMLVTIGGASVGDHDLVQQVMADLGFTLDFWKIAMRPGKPLIYGDWNGVAVLGLPGNPVSALICALNFLKPAIERLAGLSVSKPEIEMLPAAVALPANDRRQDFLRARLVPGPDGALRAQPFTRQDSSMLSALAQSDCLIIRPANAAAVSEGTAIPVLRLDRFGLGF